MAVISFFYFRLILNHIKMSIKQNIPIVFENLTGKSDFQEIIFPEGTYYAWTVIQTQSSAQFEYTADFAIQTSYEESGITYTQGPFTSKPGTAWELVEKSDNEVILQKTSEYSKWQLYHLNTCA